MKKFLKIFAALMALCIIALFTIDPKSYNSYIEQELVNAASKAHIKLAFDDLRLRYGALEAKKITALFPRYLLTLVASDVDIDVSYPSLIAMAPNISVTGNAYGGKIDVKTHYTISSGESLSQAKIDRLALNEHEFLSGFGFVSGILDLLVTNMKFNTVGLSGGEATVKIENLSKPSPSSIPFNYRGFPMTIPFPAVTGLNLTAEISVDPEALKIANLNIDSSLGSVKAAGNLLRNESFMISGVDLKSEVKLSAEGMNIAGNYLPALDRSLSSNTSHFEVVAKGPVRNVTYIYKPLE